MRAVNAKQNTRNRQTGEITGRLGTYAGRAGIYAVLIAVGVVFLLPFYWMLTSSLRPLSEFYQLPIPIVPNKPSLENYGLLFARSMFGRGIFNSSLLAAISVVLQVLLSALAGYTFAKLRFRGRGPLFIGLLATMMIPLGVGMIPNYIIMARIHWIDTFWPLILPPIANAFGIFWMRQYCLSIPDELLDAARIDGSGEFSTFWRIVLPVIKPAVASLAIFVFLTTWNDFLGPLVYLRSQQLYTVQLWLSVVSREGNVSQPGVVMAGSALASIPIVILFATLQRYFVAGLTAGSVK